LTLAMITTALVLKNNENNFNKKILSKYMDQEYLNKYKIQKIIPGELELKGYLYQLLGFNKKESFVDLARIIYDYYWANKSMYDSSGNYYLELGNEYKLNNEQVKTILLDFNIMPEYLYYFINDSSANYQTEIEKIEEEENKINILPTFYSSYKQIIMNENSLLFIFRAGGCILDVLSESGEKLSFSDDFRYLYGISSDYFSSCKISCDKKTIRLLVLNWFFFRWVEFLYENQKFIFKTRYNINNHDNFYELSEIETQYEKYLKDKEEIKKLPHSIKLFDQIWATRNLDVTHFVNGDIIPEARTSEEWDKAALNKMPAWCYYNNSELNGEKFGKLYNWYAVNDSRGLAPEGWHIPSLEEWEKLATELGEVGNIKIQGGNDWTGTEDKEIYEFCVSKIEPAEYEMIDFWGNDWTEDEEIDDLFSNIFGVKEEEMSKNNFENPKKQNLFNQTGLTILAAGGRGRFGNDFFGKGYSAFFWTSTPFDNIDEQSDEAHFVLIYINDTVMQTRNYKVNNIGFSVRCIKN